MVRGNRVESSMTCLGAPNACLVPSLARAGRSASALGTGPGPTPAASPRVTTLDSPRATPLLQVLFTLMLGLLYSIKPAPSLGTFR